MNAGEYFSNWLQSRQAKERLEYLRGELRAERISYGELAELQNLVPFIDPGDVELLEAAGVPEFPASPWVYVWDSTDGPSVTGPFETAEQAKDHMYQEWVAYIADEDDSREAFDEMYAESPELWVTTLLAP